MPNSTDNMTVDIINILKEVELYDYYKNKDVDRKENTPNIFFVDRVVLLDDVEYILNNKNEFLNEDSIYYDEELAFLEKIKQLKNKLI